MNSITLPVIALVVIAVAATTAQAANAVERVKATVAAISASAARHQPASGRKSPGCTSKDCDSGRAAALRATLRLDGGEGRFASGVIVDSDRVITAAHAIVPEVSPWADVEGIQMPAVIISTYDDLDIAVLEVPTADVDPLPTDGNPVGPGARMLIVGHPDGGQRRTIAGGVLSVLGSKMYIDAPVTEGYSGGAIMRCVDMEWSLVGVVVGFVSGTDSGSDVAIGITIAAFAHGLR